MQNREFKDRLYEQMSRIGKAVDSARRLEVLEILAQGERTVEGLAEQAVLSVANASRHLQVLREVRLVEARKEGLHVYYRLADPQVYELLRSIREVSERRLAEMDRLVRNYLGARDDLEPVSRKELRERIRAGTVVLLDVRPVEEYRAGHIPGAVSIPLKDLGRRLAHLPARKEIVAYCRGPYCVMAFEAVQALRARGRRARRLVDGFPEWRAAGLPVEASPGEEGKP